VDEQELMGIRADTLFIHDARGRMVRNNEPDGDPAPRLFLGYTMDGCVVRFGQGTPDALIERISAIIERQPPVGSLHIRPAVLVEAREALEVHAPVTHEEGGPTYRFPEPITPSPEAVRLTAANIAVTQYAYPWLSRAFPTREPCFSVVHDGAAVSICFSSRIGAIANEAGVETLPAFRGRGYALAVTAAWGAAVHAAGRIPLYSTTWDNLASQGVARRLGLVMFGADVTLA
jgi:hypothetical protein